VNSSPADNSKQGSYRSQAYWRARAPQVVGELLTLRAACARFEGLDYRQIYAWVEEGRLHPVRPGGRLLYPEWEIRALVSSDGVTPPYLSGREYERRAA
jgi:hypothetical protein